MNGKTTRPTTKKMAQRPVRKQQKRSLSTERVHGGLSDQDRIFTNLYGVHDSGIKGALKRVCYIMIILVNFNFTKKSTNFYFKKKSTNFTKKSTIQSIHTKQNNIK